MLSALGASAECSLLRCCACLLPLCLFWCRLWPTRFVCSFGPTPWCCTPSCRCWEVAWGNFYDDIVALSIFCIFPSDFFVEANVAAPPNLVKFGCLASVAIALGSFLPNAVAAPAKFFWFQKHGPRQSHLWFWLSFWTSLQSCDAFSSCWFFLAGSFLSLLVVEAVLWSSSCPLGWLLSPSGVPGQARLVLGVACGTGPLIWSCLTDLWQFKTFGLGSPPPASSHSCIWAASACQQTQMSL